MILGVENFYHRGGNIGPPIEVEFSTIFIYSALISPEQSLGCIFVADNSMRSPANFRTVFSESQNANPQAAELEPDFNAK